jgi:hypothetical protein
MNYTNCNVSVQIHLANSGNCRGSDAETELRSYHSWVKAEISRNASSAISCNMNQVINSHSAEIACFGNIQNTSSSIEAYRNKNVQDRGNIQNTYETPETRFRASTATRLIQNLASPGSVREPIRQNPSRGGP